MINGIINNFFNLPSTAKENIVLVKSIFYMRFIILYFVLKFLIKENLINFKYFFNFYAMVVIFVAIDVIIQYVFGVDLFGFEASPRRLSGPFGDEQISGSFIQRFFIFSVFSIIIFFSPKNKWLTYFSVFFVIIISAVGILLSGNRVPFVLFVMMLVLLSFYKNELRKILLPLIIIFALCFSYFFNSNNAFKTHYTNFLIEGHKIINYVKIKIQGNSLEGLRSSYIKEIESGILTWQKNKYFGGGIKSFHFNCANIDSNDWGLDGEVNCNQHPHNYYIETAAELGAFGLILFLILLTFIFVKALKKIYFSSDFFYSKQLLYTFFLVFVVEIFPFKTTGSLFTTGNATFLFIIIAFVVGLTEYKIKN